MRREEREKEETIIRSWWSRICEDELERTFRSNIFYKLFSIERLQGFGTRLQSILITNKILVSHFLNWLALSQPSSMFTFLFVLQSIGAIGAILNDFHKISYFLAASSLFCSKWNRCHASWLSMMIDMTISLHTKGEWRRRWRWWKQARIWILSPDCKSGSKSKPWRQTNID